MATDWKWLTAAGAGLASLGYLLWKCRKPPSVAGGGMKSYELNDPITLYTNRHIIEEKVLGELREMSVALKDGRMSTCAEVGKLLTIYCRALNARKAIDVGVFTGLSAYAMALGLRDDGRVIACDVSEEYTSLGKPLWKKGGVSEKIDLRLQPATDTLQELLDNGEADSFDIVFIDADKLNYVVYYDLAVELLRKGGVIIVDNAMWNGRVADPAAGDQITVTIRSLNQRIRDDPRVDFVLLNISDGVGIAQKL